MTNLSSAGKIPVIELILFHIHELFSLAALSLVMPSTTILSCSSFLTQPHLFLRLRPGKEAISKGKLQRAGIAYREISPSCLALPNASKVDTVMEVDKAVIQDLSSQRIGELMEFIRNSGASASAKAAANASTTLSDSKTDPSTTLRTLRSLGRLRRQRGKSILAFDIFKNIDLTVSDVKKIHSYKSGEKVRHGRDQKL